MQEEVVIVECRYQWRGEERITKNLITWVEEVNKIISNCKLVIRDVNKNQVTKNVTIIKEAKRFIKIKEENNKCLIKLIM